MGGFGSSRWHGYARRTLVEQTLTLNIGFLLRHGFMQVSRATERTLAWERDTGIVARTGIRITPTGKCVAQVRMIHTADAVAMDYVVRVERFLLPNGGARYFFLCPKCDSRRYKLHLPLYSVRKLTDARFLCRDCHDLTYYSSVHSRTFDCIGARFNTDIANVRRAMRRMHPSAHIRCRLTVDS